VANLGDAVNPNTELFIPDGKCSETVSEPTNAGLGRPARALQLVVKRVPYEVSTDSRFTFHTNILPGR
jgi:hypothetical protein